MVMLEKAVRYLKDSMDVGDMEQGMREEMLFMLRNRI